MNELQSRLCTALGDVTELLRNNGVPFYFHYGSMLGAIRHKGIIPWDNDIDLAVFRRDVPLLTEAMNRDLDKEKYYFHVPTEDVNPHVIIKGEDFVKSMDAGVRIDFIDIFILEDYPSAFFRKKVSDVLIYLLYQSYAAIAKLPHSLGKLLLFIPKVCRKITIWLPEEDSDLCTIYGTDYKKTVFPKGYYDNPMIMEFEGIPAPVPREYDKMMTSIYGDYMTPPPEGKRSDCGGRPCGVKKDYLESLK